MIPKPGDLDHKVHVAKTFHEQADDELTEKEKMMKGYDIGIQDKKAKLLMNRKGLLLLMESIESYYHRFSKLMNDFKRNKHFPKKIASNLKFLNNLQPEWRRHVTIVHQTNDFYKVDYTQLYDFLKYNQAKVNELRAKLLARAHDPLALMANSNNPYNYTVFHQDQPSPVTYMQQAQPNNNFIPQPSFNTNYMQQPMLNPKDIADPTTKINMAPNVGNRNGYNAVLNVRNQVVQNSGVQNVKNQNGLIVVSGIANQNRNGNVVAAQAKGNAIGNNGDLDKIEEANANCILMANLLQASTSGTQIDKAPVYDSDGSAKVQSRGNTIRELREKISRLTKKHSEAVPIHDRRYAIDVEPIPSRIRNNREVNLDYFKHLKESVETLRDIVDEAKATGKLFAAVDHQWRPTGRKFALGEQFPLTRIIISKIIMENLPPPNDNPNAPEEEPFMDQGPATFVGFAPQWIGEQILNNHNGWLEEEPEEEEEEEDEAMEDDDEDDAEVINLYEEADPHNRPPPTSDEGTEFAPPIVQIADVDNIPVPPVIQFGNFHVGESSASRDLFEGNDEVCMPGPMPCDLRSVHRGVKRLSKQIHDRYKTEKRMSKILRQEELCRNGQAFDITALDSAVRANTSENSKMMRLITDLSREFSELKCQKRRAEELSRWEAWVKGRIPNSLRFQEEPPIHIAPVPCADDPTMPPKRRTRTNPQLTLTQEDVDQLVQDGITAAIKEEHERVRREATRAEGPVRDPVTAPIARECLFVGFMKCGPTQFHGTEERFNELALLCPDAVPNENKKVELYIKGLPEIIKGETMSSRLVTLNEAVRMVHALMEQKIQSKNERIAE
nr:Gag-Pol polyprotein [Tanacetum cinerariifolium]